MTYDPASRRPPIVSDADRQWAIEQRPAHWARVVTRDGKPRSWAALVSRRASAFERHYAHDRKPAAEWAGLWRRVWWPATRIPADPTPHPFIRRADPRWPAAAAMLDAAERRVAERFGVIQFRPDDERASSIAGGANAT